MKFVALAVVAGMVFHNTPVFAEDTPTTAQTTDPTMDEAAKKKKEQQTLQIAGGIGALALIIALSTNSGDDVSLPPSVVTPASVFAEWDVPAASGSPFRFVNSDTGATLGLATQPTAVQFRFTTENGYATPGSWVDAMLTFTATADGAATTSGGVIHQALTGLTMTFTAVTPGAFGATNLLTMNASAADLAGILGGSTVAINAEGVTYTSDFLNFTNSTSFRGITTALTLNGGLAVGTNGMLADFSATGFGVNGATNLPTAISPVPEASTVLSLASLLMLGGIMVFRRRRVSNTIS